MSDEKAPKETRPHRSLSKSHKDVRAEALQKALRENLRRRKVAGSETPTVSAQRATDVQPPSSSEALGQTTPSSSEALGQETTLHEKAKENPEGDA